jgi:hypothetical protein
VIARLLSFALLVALIGVSMPAVASAQDTDVSPGRAFLYSALLPGAGQAYVQGGNWRGSATMYTAADVSLWTGLLATVIRHDQLITSYTTLASSRAGAFVEGKNRTFFLHLGSYRSSDEFREAMLRNRNWDQVDYVAERAYQWQWVSDDDFFRYRELREDAESLNRRRTFLVALLAGNRALSAVTAARYAVRSNRSADVNVNLGLHPSADLPLVAVQVRF